MHSKAGSTKRIVIYLLALYLLLALNRAALAAQEEKTDLSYRTWIDNEGFILCFNPDGTMGERGNFNGYSYRFDSEEESLTMEAEGKPSYRYDCQFYKNGNIMMCTSVSRFFSTTCYRVIDLVEGSDIPADDISIASGGEYIGSIDAIYTGVDFVAVRGWVYNVDRTEEAVQCSIYLAGEDDGMHLAGTCLADLPRSDVNQQYQCGARHGFYLLIPKEDFPQMQNTVQRIVVTVAGNDEQSDGVFEGSVILADTTIRIYQIQPLAADPFPQDQTSRRIGRRMVSTGGLKWIRELPGDVFYPWTWTGKTAGKLDPSHTVDVNEELCDWAFPVNAAASCRWNQVLANPAAFAWDGDFGSCWRENEEGDGTGSWLQFDFPEPIQIDGILIAPGDQSGAEEYGQNPAPVRIRLLTDTECLDWDYSAVMPDRFEGPFVILEMPDQSLTVEGRLWIEIMEVRGGKGVQQDGSAAGGNAAGDNATGDNSGQEGNVIQNKAAQQGCCISEIWFLKDADRLQSLIRPNAESD